MSKRAWSGGFSLEFPPAIVTQRGYDDVAPQQAQQRARPAPSLLSIAQSGTVVDLIPERAVGGMMLKVSGASPGTRQG